MKFYLDTANLKEIKEAAAMGFLDGVTTNPTLIAKEGKKFETAIRDICEVVRGPVSAECISEKYEEMVEEGRRIRKLAENVVVKIPMTPDGMKATKTLSGEGTRINVTLCFPPMQALFAAKAGASYISPFVGRLDDAGHDGMAVVRDIVTVYKNYQYPTEVLVASIRHPLHVLEAAKMGANISTMPFAVYQKLLQHPLTDVGLVRFLEDNKKIPK